VLRIILKLQTTNQQPQNQPHIDVHILVSVDDGTGEAHLEVNSVDLARRLFELDDTQMTALYDIVRNAGAITWSTWDSTQKNTVEHTFLLQTFIMSNAVAHPRMIFCKQAKTGNIKNKQKIHLQVVDFDDLNYQAEAYRLLLELKDLGLS